MTLNMCSCLPHTRQPSARPLEAASSEPSIIMQANRIPAPRALFPHSRHVLAPDLCLAAPPTTQPVATHRRPVVFSCPSSVSQLAHRSASLFRRHVPSTSSTLSNSAWLTVLPYVFSSQKSFFRALYGACMLHHVQFLYCSRSFCFFSSLINSLAPSHRSAVCLLSCSCAQFLLLSRCLIYPARFWKGVM